MNIISWYIFRQLLGPLVFITLTLTAVVWLTQSLRFLDLMISKGISAGTLAYLTLLLLPNFFVIILPIALFCAVLFVYYKLETDSELVVMKSTGLSEFNLLKPTLLLGLIITILLFLLTLFFQPLGFREFKDKQFAFRHNLAPVLGQEGAFNIIIPGVTVFVRERGPKGELRGILVHDDRDSNKPVTYIAKEGSFIIANEFPQFVLVDGTRQEFGRKNDQLSILYFDQYIVNIEAITTVPDRRWREGTERYIHQLFFPGNTPDDLANANKLRAEGHKRLIVPFYAISLALIATAGIIPFSSQRRKRWIAISLSGLTAIIFELTGMGILSLLAKTPQLTPLIYAHVFLTIAIVWLFIVKKPNLFNNVFYRKPN